MTTTTALTPAEVLADLIAEAVRRRKGAVGVLVRDVPAPDPNRLLRALAELRDEGMELRVAYLREGGQAAATEAGFTDSDFSAQVEEAERWRNDRDLTALIVVIAHGDEAKLSSLEDFSAVTSRELKHILVRRALGEEAGQNEVQVRWWRMLDEDDSIGLGPLIDYYTALVGKTGEDYLDASSREIYHLGLLPDHEFFNDPREAAVRRRLETNRELSSRLQMLNAQDRRRISEVLRAEPDPDVRKGIEEALSQLDRTRIEGGGHDDHLRGRQPTGACTGQEGPTRPTAPLSGEGDQGRRRGPGGRGPRRRRRGDRGHAQGAAQRTR